MCKFYFVPSKELAKNRSFNGSFIVETAHRTLRIRYSCREKELRIYLEDKIIERYKELSAARHIIALLI